jgi:hypothetical protein
MLYGYVKDTNDNPLRGRVISVLEYKEKHDDWHDAHVDESGRYELWLPESPGAFIQSGWKAPTGRGGDMTSMAGTPLFQVRMAFTLRPMVMFTWDRGPVPAPTPSLALMTTT